MTPKSSNPTLPLKAIIWRVALTLFILLLLAGPGAQIFHTLLLK